MQWPTALHKGFSGPFRGAKLCPFGRPEVSDRDREVAVWGGGGVVGLRGAGGCQGYTGLGRWCGGGRVGGLAWNLAGRGPIGFRIADDVGVDPRRMAYADADAQVRDFLLRGEGE